MAAIAKNNHSRLDELDRLLKSQPFTDCACAADTATGYARLKAELEGSLVVLSDLHLNTSRIFCGSFGIGLGLEPYNEEDSIWESEILKLMSTQEREEKILGELRFYNFLRHVPKRLRRRYCMLARLRLLSGIDVLHRMQYIYDSEGSAARYAICEYSPLLFEIPGRCFAVDMAGGTTHELTPDSDTTLLSAREKQVLMLIDKGHTSASIADILSISRHTVSRHRQEILSKLQVRNSIEACRTAKSMKII